MKEHRKMQRAKQNILMEIVGGGERKKMELKCFYV
jgi:hypothetical protein